MEGEINQYKKKYDEMLIQRNKFKQQCTQAIRQWDQALHERNNYQDALVKLQRQHEEAVKEVNQAMAVRIKATKDIKRLTGERNAAMQENSMIMSERDIVHKEIEKLQDEASLSNHKIKEMEARNKRIVDEKRMLICQVELLRQQIEVALSEREQALQDCHHLRKEFGERNTIEFKKLDDVDNQKVSQKDNLDVEKLNKNVLSPFKHFQDYRIKDELKNSRRGNIEVNHSEIGQLRKPYQDLHGELQEIIFESDESMGKKNWDFFERDKVLMERNSMRTMSGKLRRERDRLFPKLAASIYNLESIQRNRNNTVNVNKKLKEQSLIFNNDRRMKLLQKAQDQCRSKDSAMANHPDSQTETLYIEIPGSEKDLDLAGCKDAPNNVPPYVANINKSSVVNGKLFANDCILNVNKVDCSYVDRSSILNNLLQTTQCDDSTVSLIVKRKRTSKRGRSMMENYNNFPLENIWAASNPVDEVHLTSQMFGSRDLMKKLISRDTQTDKYTRIQTSSSSETVYNSPKKIGDTPSLSGYITEPVNKNLEALRGIHHAKDENQRDHRDMFNDSSQSDYSILNLIRSPSNLGKEYDDDTELQMESKDALEEMGSVLNTFQIVTDIRGIQQINETWPRSRSAPAIEYIESAFYSDNFNKTKSLKDLLLKESKYEETKVLYRLHLPHNNHRPHRSLLNLL